MENNVIELVKCAMKGDESSYEQLFYLYHKKAYYIAYRMTNSSADAEDAVQETFIQLRKSLPALKEPMLFEVWLSKIVHSKCKRIFRKNRYSNLDITEYENHPSQIEQREYLLPDRAQAANQDREILLRLIDDLPMIHKEVLLLVYFEQYKYKEIANILGVTENTVKSRVFLAKKTLKRSIEAYEHRTDTKFKFHSLDLAISSAFLSGFGLQVVNSSLISAMFSKLLSFVKLHGVTTTIAGSVCISSGLVAFGAYQAYRIFNDSPQEVVRENVKVFDPIQYHNEQITNSKDAYYTLVLWANKKEQILAKSQEEMLEIRPVYEKLKAHDSVYYHMLIDSGWVTIYESKITQ